MNIQMMFNDLNEKLEQLRLKLDKNTIEQADFRDEVEDLKKQSEQIVEEWLRFEEKLGQLLDQAETKASSPLSAKEEANQLYQSFYLNNDSFNDTDIESENWTKGKALYDLFMFEHAIPYLEKVVRSFPDFGMAKLYLSHAYMATSHIDKAKYHLQFLSETTDREDIMNMAFHALGCMEGSVKNFEKALNYFKKIRIEDLKPDWAYIYLHNCAQTLYQLEKYEEALTEYMKAYQLCPNDWKVPYMLGKISMKLNDHEAGLAFWFEALQLGEHPGLLKDMARYFEEKGLHQMSSQCYDRLLKYKENVNDAEAWFGLAWNYGLSQQGEKSKETFLKALSLFPDSLELQISYTWMLLFWKETKQAKRNIKWLISKNPEHPLVQGLKSLADGNLDAALESVSNGVLQQH